MKAAGKGGKGNPRPSGSTRGVTQRPTPARKSITKYPGVARTMGAEGPKKSSPRPGGVGKGGGKGSAAVSLPKHVNKSLKKAAAKSYPSIKTAKKGR